MNHLLLTVSIFLVINYCVQYSILFLLTIVVINYSRLPDMLKSLMNFTDCIEPTPSCPENEEYGCRNSCPPETCITLYAAFLCVQNQTCNQGCFCKKGFLRTTTNGTCVPPDQCLPREYLMYLKYCPLANSSS